jgi:hypothetical protein
MQSKPLKGFGPVSRNPLYEARMRAESMGPELYDALKTMVGCFDTPIMRRRIGEDSIAMEALQIARDTLAKAEGRS